MESLCLEKETYLRYKKSFQTKKRTKLHCN